VNNQQADGPASQVTGFEPLEARFASFGWHVQRVDGNDIDALVAAFDAARACAEPKPRIIICDTKMAKASVPRGARAQPLPAGGAARMAEGPRTA
jgi:transketolase